MILLRHAALTSSLHMCLAFFALRTLAIECRFTAEPFIAWNQEQVDTVLAGCTSIRGSIEIAANYTGSFSLSNITSISESIAIGYGEDDSKPGTGVTSINVRDVESIRGIELSRVPLLTSAVSFPHLSTASDITIYTNINEGPSLDFPSLTALSGDLKIEGVVSSINYPLLADVTGTLMISSGRGDFIWAGDMLIKSPNGYPPLDIEFPALQSASQFSVEGNIPSLSLPRLSTVPTGVHIATYGDPLDIKLPSLSDTPSLWLAGTIMSISIPSLYRTGNLSVYCSNLLPLSLDPLETVDRIRMSGKIEMLSMSSISSINTLKVHSLHPLDCSSAMSAWTNSNHSIASKDFECTGVSPPKKKLSLGGKLSLGIAIPLAVFLLAFIWWKVRATRKRKALLQPAYSLGAPPKYNPTMAAERYGVSEQNVGSTRSTDGSINAREPAVPASRL